MIFYSFDAGDDHIEDYLLNWVFNTAVSAKPL